eukprot:gnl/TRDRNA2_/TRDRNA2_59438_c0_seq1.p1 gnl/TRDRNA2_/TRDRNA2_59438_c0~~gnl/TRDRNA2_/TRDRNA2_59438_c0_seq1.p1  ORF type:complete len:544 (-),score=104.43 gnl/TRDRNA2_/TRDRNA2_59438_c0_seq1:72-1703(-)
MRCQEILREPPPPPTRFIFREPVGEVGPDAGFDTWLSERLSSERTLVVKHVKDQVQRQLERYRQDLLAEMEQQLLAAASPLGVTLDLHNLQNGTNKLSKDVSSVRPAAPVVAAIEKGNKPTVVAAGQDGPKPPKVYASERIRALAEEQEHQSGPWSLRKMVEGTTFECASGLVILANTMAMAAEIQYNGMKTGYWLGAPWYVGGEDVEVWPGADAAFDILAWVFMFVFTLEFVVRLAAERQRALLIGWMWLDLVLLVGGYMDLLGAEMLFLGANPMLVKMLRLARIIRVLKLVRTLKGMGSLFLLIRSLQASVGALLWSFLLLVFIQVCMAIFISQVVQAFISDTAKEEATRLLIFSYWGTFTKAMLTMFEVTLSNWTPSCRVLVANVSEWFGLLYIIYRCIFCFSMLKVISAVFITETARVAANDDHIAILKKQRAKEDYLAKVKELFIELDDNNDKAITYDEFQNLFNDPILQQFMSTLDIDGQNLKDLFKILDNGDGAIDMEEFVQGICSAHGEAKAFDIVVLTKIVRKLDAKVEALAGK